MKQLKITSRHYRALESGFKSWLQALGYAPVTTYNLPHYLRELFHYLEQRQKWHIRALDKRCLEDYYTYLQGRPNTRQGGKLSPSSLNNHLRALKKFTQYLRLTGQAFPPSPGTRYNQALGKDTWLTGQEIKQLFEASRHTPLTGPNLPVATLQALQSRDRAMLAVYYGCGLRRSEGVWLDVDDINLKKSLLHVRKGKNYTERTVPLGRGILKILQNYLGKHRGQISGERTSKALFISTMHGGRMQGHSLNLRLKKLQQQTGDPGLVQKEIGLHTLRHSIATHLLQSGMSIENISRFLGHKSLESTQIYTHLAKKTTKDGQGKL